MPPDAPPPDQRPGPGRAAVGPDVAVVCVGVATLDAIASVSHFPSPDERLVAEEISFAGGGPAATAAVALARLGVPTAYVGCVGDDPEGQRVRDELATEGVDISGVTVAPGRRTAASAVIVDRGQHTRAICTRPPPPLTTLSPAAENLLRDARWIHADHVGWDVVGRMLGTFRSRQPAAARSGPRLSVDAGNPVPDLLLRDVDLFVPTIEALRREYGDRPDAALLATAVADGADTVVATRGGHGAIAATSGGESVDVPGVAVPDLVSTLGAGDVFHGALLAALVRGLPLRACLDYANAAAALSCRGLDGRSAIPRHQQVLAAI
ncbi:MAG: carbohydrate kinase family protein [Micromonosporaceae bacterium]